MDAFFFHPKLVHVPLALGLLMPLIALGLLFAWWRAWLDPRGWLVAVALQGILVASGVAAERSGEREADRVEAFVPERFLEAHGDAAELFVLASFAVFVLMVIAFALAVVARRGAQATATVATLGTFVVLVLAFRTGAAGGRLVYEHGAAAAYVGPAAAGSRTFPEPGKRDD